MKDIDIDLRGFPAQYRSIISYYYFWKAVPFYHNCASTPLVSQSGHLPAEFWLGGKPPSYVNSVLYLSVTEHITNSITYAGSEFTVTELSNGSSQLLGRFSDQETLEKYVVFSWADVARAAVRLKRQGAIWARAGFAPHVLVDNVKDLPGIHDVSHQYLTRISYQGQTALLSKFDALRFSHALVLTISQLISVMEEGFSKETLLVPFSVIQ